MSYSIWIYDCGMMRISCWILFILLVSNQVICEKVVDKCVSVKSHLTVVLSDSLVAENYFSEKDAKKSKICSGETSSSSSCCSHHVEKILSKKSEEDFFEVLRATSFYMKRLISINAAQYREQYQLMFEYAANQTVQSFMDLYGKEDLVPKTQIQTLFSDLKKYMQRHDVNLHESVEHFFDQIFPLVFHQSLKNPQLTELTPDYNECLTEVSQELYPHPFGDIPNILAHELSKSLILGRTFLGALTLGIDTINTTDHIKLEANCIDALTRLRYCGNCYGYFEARPCRNFCYNVMRGCLATIGEIDRHWNEFINSLKALTQSMREINDIEKILRDLPFKITSSVQRAVDSGHKFNLQVIDKCGQPKQFYTESSDEIKPPALSTNENHKFEKMNVKKFDLHEKIETFIRSLMASKGFYHSLADTICSAEKFANGINQELCWNGETLGRYNKSLVQVGLEAQMRFNPEMKVGMEQTTPIGGLITRLSEARRLTTSKLSLELMQSDDRKPKPNVNRKNRHNVKEQNLEGSGYYDDGEYYDKKIYGKYGKNKKQHKNDGPYFSDDEDLVYASGSGSGDSSNDEDIDIKKIYRDPPKSARAPKGGKPDDFYLSPEKPENEIEKKSESKLNQNQEVPPNNNSLASIINFNSFFLLLISIFNIWVNG